MGHCLIDLLGDEGHIGMEELESFDENVSDILSLQETFKNFPVICAVDNFTLEI